MYRTLNDVVLELPRSSQGSYWGEQRSLGLDRIIALKYGVLGKHSSAIGAGHAIAVANHSQRATCYFHPEEQMKLDGKKALITGGNSGIGLATARLFIAEGAQVAITGRNQETLDAALKELGPKAIGFKAEISDAADRARVFKGIGEKFGSLDIVFANAGVAGPTPLGSADEKLFDEILKVNVTGVFFTIQGALPFLHEGASVILNGSTVATLGPPVSTAYVASKGAVRSMSRSLAAELAPKGIRVNVVSPGVTVTPIYARRLADNKNADHAALAEKRFGNTVPLGRLGKAEEIAMAVLFLASSDSSYVHGAELLVDGGAAGAPLGAPVYRS